jgi:hypothetical protein
MVHTHNPKDKNSLHVCNFYLIKYILTEYTHTNEEPVEDSKRNFDNSHL